VFASSHFKNIDKEKGLRYKTVLGADGNFHLEIEGREEVRWSKKS